jgi:tetratricopeptide (TPR) repeat protein
MDAVDTLTAARAALAACNYPEAERLALEAAASFRVQGAAEEQSRALQVAGWSWYNRGELREAAALLRRALVPVDGQRGLEDVAAAACHSLGSVHALMRGGFGVAEAMFRRAAALYGPDHPRMPALRSDRAWRDLIHGRYGAALAEIRPAAEAMVDDASRSILLANLFVSVAGEGLRVEALHRAEELRALIEGGTTCGTWPRVGLAWGTALLGERDAALSLALEAREAARAAGELFAFNRASALVDQLR